MKFIDIISGVTQWPYLIQVLMLLSLATLLWFSFIADQAYVKKAMIVVGVLVALFAYRVMGSLVVAGFFLSLSAVLTFYSRKRNIHADTQKYIFAAVLIILGIIIASFNVFAPETYNVYISVTFDVATAISEPFIRKPFGWSLYWYTQWGIFAVVVCFCGARYIKIERAIAKVRRIDVPMGRIWVSVSSAVLLAFWVTLIGVKYMGDRPYMNNLAFYPITKEIFYELGPNATNGHSMTRLQLAAEEGDLDEVKELVKRGADVNLGGGRSLLYKPPLMRALNKHYDVFVFLVENGAKINADAGGGYSLIHKVKYGDGDDKRFLEYMLQNGIELHRPVPHGTPLLHATVGGRFDIEEGKFLHQNELAEVLLKNGADVNAVSEDGTPLHYAVIGANLAGVKMLISFGADPKSIAGRSRVTPKNLIRLLAAGGSNISRSGGEDYINEHHKIYKYLSQVEARLRLQKK
jgi:hypothetical protein